MELVQPSDVNKNLFILPGGTVPPNPTELLARNGLDKAIETLKKNFDYVILDTAPIGMVTDTLLIGRIADLSVYVCRADYTHKAEYTLINELSFEKKLPNLCTVINGVDLKKRKYGYTTATVSMASITAMANVMATAMDMAKIQKDKYLNIYEL